MQQLFKLDEAVAETPGKPADPNANECVTKAETKFDGGPERLPHRR